MGSATNATAAELSAAAEIVGRYRHRVADLVQPHLGTERDDLVSALYEAERSLHGAERALLRALKMTGT